MQGAKPPVSSHTHTYCQRAPWLVKKICFAKQLLKHTLLSHEKLFIVSSPHHLTHQAVELWHRAFVAWVTNVPDLDTTLPSSVNVSSRVTDGHGTNHLSVVQCVDLASVARDPWAYQSIWRKRHRLHLSIGCHVEGIGTGDTRVGGQNVRGGGQTIHKAEECANSKKRGRKYWRNLLTSAERFSMTYLLFYSSFNQDSSTFNLPQNHLRFATRDSRQTGRHSRNSHMRMRVKTNLDERTKTFYEHSANIHTWALAKCTHESILFCVTGH